jgi:spore maturation protein SpmB
MAGTLYGSTETTFYVIAVYFGSVNIRKTRHAIAAGLIADLSVLLQRSLFAGCFLTNQRGLTSNSSTIHIQAY